MAGQFGRRQFLAGIAGVSIGANLYAKENTSNKQNESTREVRMEYLKPAEIDKAQKQCPTMFQPLGTIEWHGVHNCVGVDALKAHALCVRAAKKGGGLVCPTLYGGVGGLDQPHTFVMEPEDDVFSNLLRGWVEKLCKEMVRDAFKAIIILTGHYGAAQQIVVRETAVRMTRALGIPVLGTPEYMIALDVGYHGDHAAWGETSLMMELHPDTVDLSRLGDPPHRGVGGRDPRQSSKKDGKLLADTIVNRLATLAGNMPGWDYQKIDAFGKAEAALVARQLSAPRGKKPFWEAWKNNSTAMRDYGKFLAAERFEDIEACVAKL